MAKRKQATPETARKPEETKDELKDADLDEVQGGKVALKDLSFTTTVPRV